MIIDQCFNIIVYIDYNVLIIRSPITKEHNIIVQQVIIYIYIIRIITYYYVI